MHIEIAMELINTYLWEVIMYSYSGSLLKKNGTLQYQLKRNGNKEIPLNEETCLAGLNLSKKNSKESIFLKDFRTYEKE